MLQIQEQRFPGNPWRSTGYQRPTRNLGRTPHQRRWIPKGDCDPLGSRILAGAVERGGCAVAGLLAGPVTLQGPTLEQSAAPVGRTHTGEIHGGLSPVGSTPGRSRGRLWGVLPLRRKEHRAETGQTNHSSHLLSPCTAGGEKVEKLGVKLSPRFYFISHYPSLNCTNFPKSVVLTIATGEWCLPVLIPTH